MADRPGEDRRRRFIEAREGLGLTQEDAAAQLGLSTASISRKERGKQPVTARDLAAIQRLSETSPRLDNVPRGTDDDVQQLERRAALAITRANQRRNEGASAEEVAMLRSRVEVALDELLEASTRSEVRRMRTAVALARLALMPSDAPTASRQETSPAATKHSKG